MILESSLVRFLAPSSSPALANEGLFELTRRPSLTRAVSLSSVETTEDPGCSQVKKTHFNQSWPNFEYIWPSFAIKSPSFAPQGIDPPFYQHWWSGLFFAHILRHLFFTVKKLIVNWDTWIKSRPFPCSFLLAGPRQRRAFWADSAPFVDTGRLVVIRGNYREPGCSQVKMTYLTNFDLILAFLPDYNRVLGSFCRWRRDGPCQWRAPSQLQKPFVDRDRWGERSKETDETRLFQWNYVEGHINNWEFTNRYISSIKTSSVCV